MRPQPFLLLIAGFMLVLMVGEVDAEKGPLWSYTTVSWRNTVAISADGEYIAAGSSTDDDKVYLFDKDSSTPLWNYTAEGDVYSVAISADGEYIVAGSLDNKVYLFDKDSSTPLWSYTTENSVKSVSISADGEYIVAASDSYKFYLFDKDSSTPLWSYDTGDDSINAVSISADGEYIAAGTFGETQGNGGLVYLFLKDSDTPLWNYTIEEHGQVFAVALSADGEYIVAGSGGDDNVYLFNKDSSTPLWSYDAGKSVWSVAISADGEYIAAGRQNGRVYLFDKDSSTPLWNYNNGDDSINAVSISADGEYIAAGDSGGEIYLFNKDSGTPLWSDDIGYYVQSVAISADDNYIAAGSSVDGEEEGKVYLFFSNLPPTATIDSISPSPARFDAEITFSGSGSDSDGNVTAYLWISSIDGELSTEANFSITGLSVGNHTISFRVQDNDGNWSKWDFSGVLVYPNAPPVATIDSIDPSSARSDAEVTFSGSGSDSDGTVVAYEWTSDIDGFLSDEGDFSMTDLGVGYHNIIFRVQDNDGEWSEWDTAELEIYLNTPPEAQIDSISPLSARFDTEITFSGSGSDSDGTVVAYEWTSDIDGFLSDEGDFSMTDLGGGYHTISFRVQDNDGGWSEGDTAELEIYPNARPEAQIDSIFGGGDQYLDNTEGCEYYNGALMVCTSTDSVVSFNGTGYDNDGTIVAYEWDSSIDGILSVERNFTITGLSIGQHTITLRAQDNDGEWSIIYSDPNWPLYPHQYRNERIVEVVPNLYPEVTINSLSSSDGETYGYNVSQIYFDYAGLITVNAATNDFDGSIVLYCWQLNNEVPTCMGDYSDYVVSFSDFDGETISLIVTDNDGDTGSDSISFYYYASPIAYAGDDIVVKPNATVDFNGQGTDADGTIVKYEWDLNADGVYEWSSSDNGALSYTYVNEGIYTLTLRVTDDNGHTSTDSRTITVTNNPSILQAGDDDGGGIPAPSLAAAVAAVAVIALRRRRGD